MSNAPLFTVTSTSFLSCSWLREAERLYAAAAALMDGRGGLPPNASLNFGCVHVCALLAEAPVARRTAADVARGDDSVRWWSARFAAASAQFARAAAADAPAASLYEAGLRLLHGALVGGDGDGGGAATAAADVNAQKREFASHVSHSREERWYQVRYIAVRGGWVGWGFARLLAHLTSIAINSHIRCFCTRSQRYCAFLIWRPSKLRCSRISVFLKFYFHMVCRDQHAYFVMLVCVCVRL